MQHGQVERQPAIPTMQPMDKKRSTLWFENQNVNTAEEVHEILPQGLRTMDRGIKNYFSGMRVPTKDGVKLMAVRITGGDKPYLIWKQDLIRGRIQLPVMSIKRDSDEFNVEKFSPAHFHYLEKRFADESMTRIILSYRPIPLKINYSLSVWAEFKRDLEYINYQIKRRFNPIAQYDVEDEYLRCSCVLLCNGSQSTSDDEVPADQRQNKRFDVSIVMEGYLPLPVKVVPSILGRVTTMKDGGDLFYGDVLQTIQGKGDVVTPSSSTPQIVIPPLVSQVCIFSAGAVTATALQPFIYKIQATGNPTSYNAVGLPNGLKLDSATGLITGTPTDTGQVTFTVQATNALGTGSNLVMLTIQAVWTSGPQPWIVG